MDTTLKAFLITLMVLFNLTACDVSELGKKVAETYDLPKPTVWAMRDGTKVDIGDKIVSIVGSDICHTGFGDRYSCWKYSMIPGSANLVFLSDKTNEIWETVDAGDDRIFLVRPNGFKVRNSE